ncbi:WD40-repeat-containing domain protein [Chytridium lagenaria]|nr:WD40-repeat-containing domain protein [Chytridium lagenaria]
MDGNANFILNETDTNNPEVYSESYGRLRTWIEGSLDTYKIEMKRVLYPVFVHAYLDLVQKGSREQAQLFFNSYRMDHAETQGQDIARLASITEPSHVETNDLAQRFLNNRYNLKLSHYSFGLLLAFLQENNFTLLTGLINKHLAVKKVDSTASSADEDIGIGGHFHADYSSVNEQQVLLGKLPDDPWLVKEVSTALHNDSFETSSSREELMKNLSAEPAADSPSRDSIPLPYSKFTDVSRAVESLKELRNRVRLSGSILPSICSYTFHNTYNTMNCVSVSDDSKICCVGTSDSFIRVWNLTGIKLRSVRISSDGNVHRDEFGSDSKRLVGHSGPVYGLSVSKDNKFLVSASEDKTVRLWSLDTFMNVVVYKGHNYPVWDVDFSKEGNYFATCSHDRTARLWSTDTINPLRIFVGHNSDVDTVRFHPNSNYIATGASDGQTRLWEINKGSCVRMLNGQHSPITALCFSPDGHMLATGNEDGTIRVWDLGMGKVIKRLKGHEHSIYSVSFSRDGSQLASGGADNTVRIWDIKGDGGDPDGSISLPGREGALCPPIGTFPTKRTPIMKVHYMRTNVLLALGPFQPPI